LPDFPEAELTNPKPREATEPASASDGEIDPGVDYQHGTVEVYNRRGRHIGEFDPHTAERLKGPNSDYQVEP
jgi:hypothetical protein